jgi:hypothetical protein
MFRIRLIRQVATAALPQHIAVSLRLTGHALFFSPEAMPRLMNIDLMRWRRGGVAS